MHRSATLDGSDFEDADMTLANVELAQVSTSQTTRSRLFSAVYRLTLSFYFLLYARRLRFQFNRANFKNTIAKQMCTNLFVTYIPAL